MGKKFWFFKQGEEKEKTNLEDNRAFKVFLEPCHITLHLKSFDSWAQDSKNPFLIYTSAQINHLQFTLLSFLLLFPKLAIKLSQLRSAFFPPTFKLQVPPYRLQPNWNTTGGKLNELSSKKTRFPSPSPSPGPGAGGKGWHLNSSITFVLKLVLLCQHTISSIGLRHIRNRNKSAIKS